MKFDKYGMRSGFSLDVLEVSLGRGLAKVSVTVCFVIKINTAGVFSTITHVIVGPDIQLAKKYSIGNNVIVHGTNSRKCMR